MARIRSDKPEAYQSETLAEISIAAERTFKGMATIADDRGRLADKPAQINGELWSMRERDNHTREDLEAELQEMVKAVLVCRYTGCDGKRYLHFVSWDKHQKIDRPSKSRLPRCPAHQVAPDYCGIHAGDCSFTEGSRNPREPSRGLQPAQTGHPGNEVPSGRPDQGEMIAVEARHAQTSGQQSSDQGERESSRDSRESSMQDRGSRTVDRGSVPPSAGAAKPRRAATKPREPSGNAGDVIAAYVEGAQSTGQPRPAETLRARVGKQANQLLAEGYDLGVLVAAARTMGAGEWNDLAVQVRKDAAAANGRASPDVHAESTASQRARQAVEAGRRVQAMLDGGGLP